jgi:DNA-binding response OmpR family regulator
MISTPIRLLQVEDDRIQQAMIARKLLKLQDYQFDISVAASEDEALSLFRGGEFDLIILDYHLNQGDGLSCLNHIRQIDQTVPVIAISGVATDEVAMELISAGADDYLAKQTLNDTILGQSIRNVLTRARFATSHAINES